MKTKGRHVLVVRQEVVHEQRNVADTLCFDGASGTPDQRHGTHACLPVRMQPGEKALVLSVHLLYCTNDTDREWCFELTGELWDNHTGSIRVVVPPRAKGVVPSLDRLVYRNEVMAKCPEFMQYLGQEHAILGAHSTYVTTATDGIEFTGQLFRENDPFLQFLRNNWAIFPELAEFDIQLVAEEPFPVYRVSQRAIDRTTHFFKTVFGKIKYKTRDTPLFLKPTSVVAAAAGENKNVSASFSGVVVMLSLDYVVVAPAAPSCRIMDHPLNLIL
jgi:hypothetical protein